MEAFAVCGFAAFCIYAQLRAGLADLASRRNEEFARAVWLQRQSCKGRNAYSFHLIER